MGQHIGINFGTTNTAVVHIQDNEYGQRITHLGESGEYPFSSIVAIPKNGGKLLFGRSVRDKRNITAQTHEVFTSMKSYLGMQEQSGEPYSFVVGEQRYYPKEVVAAFFMYIKEYIFGHFNIDITEASFSYPIDFTPQARRELYEAAQSAGIEVKAFVNEATAAYIASRKEGKVFSKVMVLDWGGGTFDISILKLTGNTVYEVAVWGDHIGGDDIDVELAERVHSRIAAESGINGGRFEDMKPSERDDMITRCEEAKISISEDEEDYLLRVHDYGDYGTRNVSITAKQFNDIVTPIIKARVLVAIDKALGKAGGLSPSSIDAVFIIGGSSNLRAYERAISNLFASAKIIYDKDKAQWATAIGAALVQIIQGKYKLSDGIGVLLSDDSIFTILPSGLSIGKQIDPITFSLVEHAYEAHFIFTNETGCNVYEKQNVLTKGFLQEDLILSAIIGHDHIAKIEILNKFLGNSSGRSTKVEISKLNFHYDLSDLGKV